MKKITTILIVLVFNQFLFAQIEIVGKVQFFKSFESEWEEIESSSDRQIKLLNSREHRILVKQGLNSFETRTDSTGIFTVMLDSLESLQIEVNKKSKVLYEFFSLSAKRVMDTLELHISDKKLALYKDSIQATDFYQKYNEGQAELDFKNGNARLLGSGSFISEKIIKRREKFSKKYGFKYDYIFGCMRLRAQDRITFRYNKVMKNLLGINENVW